MFPWCSGYPICDSKSSSTRRYRENQLQFLKWVRDSLETRLAAVNAAIVSVEGQLNRDGEDAA
jgi:hypothetical protein